MTNRIYNFGAGPAMLPESLLKEAQKELLNWQNLGVSILEVGHRTSQFKELLASAEQSLRQLLAIPKNYHVLFLGMPARAQFAMIPLNLLKQHQQAGYIVTGVWSHMALQEAQCLKQAYCIAPQNEYLSIPESSEIHLKKHTTYLYYTPNETVNGLRFPYLPDSHGLPLIADMTSCLLSEPIEIADYGLIFAGAQKNIANAGLTVVIIRDDLLHQDEETPIPTLMNYNTHVTHGSLYATPPVFNCYLAAKMFSWIQDQGGVASLFAQNTLKAKKLYQYLDSSEFYLTKVAKEARSLMNVCFYLAKMELEEKFVDLALKKGLYALKGHRLVGGLRASLYNAMPMAGVDSLIEFMEWFAKEHS